MRRVAAKFVPKLLNCDQKQHRMNIANEMLDSVRDDPNLLQRVITGDEAWVYGYDVEPKLNHLKGSCRTNQDRKKRTKGVVHHVFLPQGITINKEYYLHVMRNLREAILQKRQDLWKNKNWLLHHDNAPDHTSLLVRDLLAKTNTLMMPTATVFPRSGPLATSACVDRSIRRMTLAAPQSTLWPFGRMCRTHFILSYRLEQLNAHNHTLMVLLKKSANDPTTQIPPEISKLAASEEHRTSRQRGIMVCKAIAYDRRSSMIYIEATMTVQRYLDYVLRPVTLHFL
ncbi:hypothetical protein LAZ67_5004271 [Cordylochernes scorpioides]|uniref:Transposase n=1 Tax=Cordylochernes scorpioides TaxID=51811 RepID=A0ABY6KJQ1_9ARAC|nr:hypothetical protein LAZ67_5004271 [Cordylochernes scorpioides]